jgi:hypothetical protein
MSKELSAKEILKRQKHQKEFTLFQLNFIQLLDQEINYGTKTFKNFAVDPSQIPCLLMMNIINYLRKELPEEDFDSFKDFTHDALEGILPELKPMLKIVKNETHQ